MITELECQNSLDKFHFRHLWIDSSKPGVGKQRKNIFKLPNNCLHRICIRPALAAATMPVFQAMWLAADDPPLGHWRHAGLMQTFCLGKWATPPILPTSLAAIYKRLLALYDLRLDADYRALPVDQTKAQQALETASQVFKLITPYITP